ncbi:SLAC1 anion channel family protein [Modicisalibacter luteus]|uniref:SLAC1 anion channel family protein n=1 Tax=Modicisalibacter luteus TaxID=453962 RepID=A0ABV7M460_9GAMM|nr:SLAC1 anion channel family protein [Halomonas lutea]GHA88079.1 C4-dicarboxylate ABC transporter [Halomonas lutea]
MRSIVFAIAQRVSQIAWLTHVPINSFAVAIGLSSFTITFREVERAFGFAGIIAEAIALLAVLSFMFAAGLYLGKTLMHWSQVRREFSDPAEMQLFAMVTIALLLLALVIRPYGGAVTFIIWSVAALSHLALVIVIVRGWILNAFETRTFSPAWMLSVGGILVASMTGARLGFVEVAWFFLSSGLMMWIIMFTIAIHRLTFHERIQTSLTPSLFLLMTPPSAAFLAYLQLNGDQLDVLARVLFFTALFLAGILASLAPVLLRVGFSLGCWAFTFPSAALTIATLRYHGLVANSLSLALASVILSIAILLFVATCWRTIGWLLSFMRIQHKLDFEGDRPCSAGRKRYGPKMVGHAKNSWH